MLLPSGADLGEVVKALTAIGATTQDLVSILQALKAAARCVPSWKLFNYWIKTYGYLTGYF